MKHTHIGASPPEKFGGFPSDIPREHGENSSNAPNHIIGGPLATLKAKLADPSTPPACIPGLEAAIARVESRSRRASALAEDRLTTRLAAELLDHARQQCGTLESALSDFREFDATLLGEMGERVLCRAHDLDREIATPAPRRQYRSCLNPYRRKDY